MHTYTFKTVSGGRAKINAGSGFFVPKSNPGIFENSDSVLLNFQNEDDLIIYPANDTVIIDGTTHAAGSWSVTAMSDAINVLFPKANSSSGGTGGASARFGYPGEDATSDGDRDFDAQQHGFGFYNTSSFYLQSSLSGVGLSGFTGNNNGLSGVGTWNATMYANDYVNDKNTILIVEPDKISIQSNILGNHALPLAAQGIFADETGNIPLVPTQSFDSNAEAVAALGVGMLYKSTTLINGSPIILITV